MTGLVDDDADARAHSQLMSADAEGVAERVADPLREHGRTVGACVLGKHCELVAPETRGKVRSPQRGAQSLGHCLEEMVADVVAKAVVHHLEAIKVQVQHRGVCPGSIGVGDRADQVLEEQQAVGQSRQRVVVRQVAHLIDRLGVVESDARLVRKRNEHLAIGIAVLAARTVRRDGDAAHGASVLMNRGCNRAAQLVADELVNRSGERADSRSG